MKLAQIYKGRAWWVFDADAVPMFAPDIVIKDITNLSPQPQEGWDYDSSTDTFSPPNPIQTLAQAQEAKRDELNLAFTQGFLKGFVSAANGSQIKYGCSPDPVNGLPSDQQNMSDELNSVNAGIAVYPIQWAALDGSSVSFTTADQFKQLCQDFYSYKWAQITNLRTRIAAVQAATTIEAVSAITW
ncbi:hypothetical protein [Desulfosporosinus sp. FKB]|uniref:DUF4376 domain-containing protein n=1 Tax=Desulfosporosinus sp. FKB TaxID=1969835 RepID=UPI000B4A4D08|nr:hypothetical protein [Desulfosporosinus sp. FKB]